MHHCGQGGIFVLEPQPWVSYEKNRRVSEVLFFLQSHNPSYSTITGMMVNDIFFP